ncbi:DUF2637 domain-containing protein [Rhodococcus sp. 14-2470-1a]|uniref:DUF2637 domain-containing protein n=1 Tax=Rhodococcus sp. 14-2470-1a TaxID=2023150 RepID=UPI000B9B3CF6|nr:DUF2637 domain-containing protein [Rhodococcus sp. 14-2470-1a]OZF47595.1 hypothetical protein CH292_19430 [Rhodococcus sp. 14-2470-1a]
MSRFPSHVSIIGTVTIALGAFWLSFTALQDLALRSHVPPSQAWVWPLIVDGLVVVATVAVVALREHRWYAWSLLAAGATLSLACNMLHATYAGELPVAVRILVASVPPLCLLAVTHLTVLLTRRDTSASVAAGDGPVVVEMQTVKPAPLITTLPTATKEVADLGASFRASRAAS